MKIFSAILTKNPCYTRGRNIKVQGIMLHSVGCPQPSAQAFVKSWNTSSANVAVHAFIDGNNGTVYQTLPWYHRGWHCGSGQKGSGNNTHIGVEMCEPSCIKYKNGSAFTCSDLEAARTCAKRTYESAVELFAMLCEKYNLDPLADGVIISHAEGYRRGIASNHGDPEHLWRGLALPYTMNGFRAAVKARMGKDIPTQKKPVESPVEADTGAIIWGFLKGKGLNDFAVAGIMGNLYAESGLKPTNLQNTFEKSLNMTDAEYTAAVDNGSYKNFVRDGAGYGLAQWTYWGRKQALLFEAQIDQKSIGNLGLQLDFLWEELQNCTYVMDVLKNTKSVLEASNVILLQFERPADTGETMRQKRAAYGQGYFNKYAGQAETEVEEVRYNKIADMPAYAQPTINKLIEKGYLSGYGTEKDEDGKPADLNISDDMIRMLVINDRAGVYGG